MKQTFSNGKLVIEVDLANPKEVRRKKIRDSKGKAHQNWTKAEILDLLREIDEEYGIGLGVE